MFKVVGNSVLEQQIKAAEKEAFEILSDEELSPISRASALREALQMKERAARFILEQMGQQITLLKGNGVSSVSLVVIAEAYKQALESSADQMQVFAKELAGLTHNKEMEEGYSYISERLSYEAEALIIPLRESKEKALSDLDSMVFAEIYDTWQNMENKPI